MTKQGFKETLVLSERIYNFIIKEKIHNYREIQKKYELGNTAMYNAVKNLLEDYPDKFVLHKNPRLIMPMELSNISRINKAVNEKMTLFEEAKIMEIRK